MDLPVAYVDAPEVASGTICSPDGKLRDRDVQGERNILWLTQALFFGLPRPDYMCRG